MGQGQAAYYEQARQAATEATEAGQNTAEESSAKEEKAARSHAPAEDAHDVPVKPDEKGSSESESKSAMEQKYGKPGEGEGSRQREQGSTVAQQARVEHERREQQRRRAAFNAVQRQNEADLGPEM